MMMEKLTGILEPNISRCLGNRPAAEELPDEAAGLQGRRGLGHHKAINDMVNPCERRIAEDTLAKLPSPEDTQMPLASVYPPVPSRGLITSRGLINSEVVETSERAH